MTDQEQQSDGQNKSMTGKNGRWLFRGFCPPRKLQEPLDASGLVWFNELYNRYRSVVASAQPDNSAEAPKIAGLEIEKLWTKKDDEKLQQDLFDLENWLLLLLKGKDLVVRLQEVRADYQEVLGQDAWKEILPNLLKDDELNDDGKIRAELRRLQGGLHWQASIRPWAQHTRQEMMAMVLGMMVAFEIMALIILWLSDVNLAAVIFMAGILGGFVGTIQRIQSANLETSRALNMARHSSLYIGVIISPVLGGIFAMIMTLFILVRAVTPGFVIPDVTVTCSTNCVCASTNAIVKSPTFSDTNSLTNLASMTLTVPDLVSATSTVFSDQAQSTSHPPVLTNNSNAKSKAGGESGNSDSCKREFLTLKLYFASGKDLVLLILWAFAAGFSERLVPDLLTRLQKSEDKS